MSWHVVCRSGPEDNFMPTVAAGDGCFTVAPEASGAGDAMRSNIGERLREGLGRSPDGTVADLITLATAVFASDVCILREFGDDRWCRDITVYVPVEAPSLWTRLSGLASTILGFLTGDHWSFEFRNRDEAQEDTNEPDVIAGDRPDVVSLFSGGLDSLVGVIDLLSSGRRVALVGHYGAGMTRTYQARVFDALNEAYPDQAQMLLFHAQPPAIKGLANHEQTMRSRSFLFFSLGVGVASLLGSGVPLFVPENGLISVNVPLTEARAGSLSTRTTHPHFVSGFRGLLSGLDLEHPLVLPYRLKTKGQMLRECADQKTLAKGAPLTMSCAHSEGGRWDGATPGTHCGYCYPCLIRRAATTFSGTPDAPYMTDVLTEELDATTDKGRDIRALSMAVERFQGRATARAIFDVLDSGPIPAEEISAYAAMYRNGMNELGTFLTSGEP